MLSYVHPFTNCSLDTGEGQNITWGWKKKKEFCLEVCKFTSFGDKRRLNWKPPPADSNLMMLQDTAGRICPKHLCCTRVRKCPTPVYQPLQPSNICSYTKETWPKKMMHSTNPRQSHAFRGKHGRRAFCVAFEFHLVRVVAGGGDLRS